MTKTEALKLVFTVKSVYPVYYRNVEGKELEAMADMWAAVLKNYPVSTCINAVIRYQQEGHTEVLQSAGQVVKEIQDMQAEEDKGDFFLPPNVEMMKRRCLGCKA